VREVTTSSIQPTAGHRVSVIGDVAGHLDELHSELRRLGAHPDSGRLPDDLTVIQVGDLVHRGPDSDGVIALVDHYLTDQPGQWVQLVGNHEAQYLREPAFHWPERLAPDSVETLCSWWAHGQLQVAVAVRTPAEDFLVTHAGLTAGYWDDILGGLADVTQVAAALNSFIGTHEAVLFHAGQMLGGGNEDRTAGPVWAGAATELVPSWLGTELPFSQVHGHSSVYDWEGQFFRATEEVIRRTVVDRTAKHAVVSLAGGRIIGVDPGHGRRPQRPWRAWELPT
jgi:hypothetical protein